ncbi:MAG: hypothetical protein HDS24_00340 [Bacteroides sp.]|nr:hypothetical protein [Bacteroides sp.]
MINIKSLKPVYGITLAFGLLALPMVGADLLVWEESFSAGTSRHITGVDTIAGKSSWELFGDAGLVDGIKSHDGDNGFIVMTGEREGVCSRILTDTIDLQNTSNPFLKFHVYNLPAPDQKEADQNIVWIYVDSGNGFEDLTGWTVEELCDTTIGWATGMLNLSDFCGERIRLAIECESVNRRMTIIDNISIEEYVESNPESFRISLPGVSDIKISGEGKDVKLSWLPPKAFPDTITRVTESFEAVFPDEELAQGYDGWGFIDLDGGHIGGIFETELPGIEYGSRQSFWVMDTSHDNLTHPSYQAHNGERYLSQMYAMGHGNESQIVCDDWAISPLLSEEAQTISLFARSYGEEEKERFKVMYSLTDATPESFIEAGAENEVPSEWTEFSFDIPEGARYFAIRCVSDRGFMLHIDDISYSAASARNVKFLGYNFYRGGELRNDFPITEEFVRLPDFSLSDKGIPLAVTAVYSHGESNPEVLIPDNDIFTGLNGAESDDNVTIEGGIGVIRFNTEKQTIAKIYSTDGVLKFSEPVKGVSELSVSPGIYVVTAGGKRIKVRVR